MVGWMTVGGLTYGSLTTLYRVQRLLRMIRRAESVRCIWTDSEWNCLDLFKGSISALA